MNRTRNFLVGSAVLVLLAAALGAGGWEAYAAVTGRPEAVSSPGPIVAASPRATLYPTPTPTPTPSPTPGVLMQAAGQGNGATPGFSAPESWTLYYQWDCRAIGSGIFNASLGDATLVQESAPTGSSSRHVSVGGPDVQLKITSGCSWSVRGEVP